MQRIATSPRADWPKIVESQGLTYHSLDGLAYWDESAYYLFERSEVDAIEAATYQLDRLCLQAVEHVVAEGRFDEVGIPEEFAGFVAESWERDEHTIYGRFDLSFDGKSPPKLLEYNADTPTSLLEGAVIQWFWAQAIRESAGDLSNPIPELDQFNSIHEKLIDAWRRVGRELGKQVAFSALDGVVEDQMTVAYLRDTAIQAGLQTESLPIEQVGWHERRGVFTDVRERSLPILFKLYPWEWMIREEFGGKLIGANTKFLEPPWKMILSSKGILPILFELFPESPYLLPTGREPLGPSFVAKPIHSREGANVTIVHDNEVIAQTEGEYGDPSMGSGWVYQEYCPLPDFDGRRPVVGSWIVNGHACGLGVREDDGPITRNTSRFVPHLFRRHPGVNPPALRKGYSSGGSSANQANPLWDRWLDR